MPLFADSLLVAVGGLAGGVGYAAWRNRDRADTGWLAGMVGFVALWAVAHVGTHHTTGRLHLGFEKLSTTAILPLSVCFFAFVLAYTGRRGPLVRRVLAALFVWPVALGALIWVPDGQLPLSVWTAFEAERGVAFWGTVGVSYALLGLGTGLLVQHVRVAAGLFRRQGVAILAGMTAAWLGSIVSVLDLFGSLHLHALPVGFLLMGGCLVWGVVDSNLTRVAPTTNRTVVRRVNVGVVAFDADGRVTNLNPAAARLLDIEERPAVLGQPVAGLLDHRPALRDWVRAYDASTGASSRTFKCPDRVLECELSALSDAPSGGDGAVLLLHDITEQQRQREQLERQNDRLEEFGSMVSHDLRNPLNVATIQLSLAREEHDSDHLATASGALERMETLIADLRRLTRHGQSIEETERVTLSTAAERAWSTVETRQATLTVDSDRSFEADPARLRQLFENLFRNAVEHSSTSPGSQARQDAVEHSSTSPRSHAPEDAVEHSSTSPGSQARQDAVEHAGSDISITVGVLEDGFYVADDGPGIPESEREQVFAPGFSTAEDGTGIGLAIVREIVEAHGWTVRAVASERGGARFEVTGVATREDVTDPPR